LYVGTEAGNVRFVDVHQFTLSVYGVLWNQAISVQQKEKPGAVVIISEQPTDTNKLLIGYQQGQLVLWDLKLRQAVFRLKHASPFSCASWLSDGSKFVCGHLNGLLTVWSSKNPPSLLETLASSHHGKEDEILSPVTHVEWLSRSGRDPMLLYAGGMPRSHSLNQGCLTALHGKSTEVSMFSAPILGLNCLCQQPYRDEVRDPLAALVLLRNKVTVLDLTTPGFPEIENPLPVNIHMPPVTSTAYYTGIYEELLCDLWSIPAKAAQEKRGSHHKWPFRGGNQGDAGESVTNDIIITGHLDGSVRLWDASSVTLFPLITVKVAHLFFILRKQSGPPRGCQSQSGSPTSQQIANASRGSSSPKECPVDQLPIQQMLLFPEDHMLVIVTVTSCAILCPFNKSQKDIQIKNLDLVIPQSHQEGRLPDTPMTESPGNSQDEIGHSKDRTVVFPAGFQPSFLCHVKLESNNSPPQISTVDYCSSFGLLAVGTACSLSLVDVIQQQCVWSRKSRDLPSLFHHHLQVSTPHSSSLSPTSPGSAPVSNESTRRNPFDIRRIRKTRSPTVPVTELLAQTEKRKKSGSMQLSKKAQSSGNLQETKSQLPEIHDQDATDGGKPEIQNEVETVYFNVHKDAVSACLWIGMSMGYVVCMGLQIPPRDKRLTDPVSSLPDGSVYQLKFPLILISSAKIQAVSPNISPKPERKPSARHSSPTVVTAVESTYMVLCTDHQIRVHDVPEHNSYKTDVVKGQYSYLKAKVVTVTGQPVLFCLTSHGHIVIFSLPKVKVLFDVDSKLPVNEMRIWRTFAMGNHGEALYMGSGNEIQRISVLKDDGHVIIC
jgi:syntaxin-binding protein 5